MLTLKIFHKWKTCKRASTPDQALANPGRRQSRCSHNRGLALNLSLHESVFEPDYNLRATAHIPVGGLVKPIDPF